MAYNKVTPKRKKGFKMITVAYEKNSEECGYDFWGNNATIDEITKSLEYQCNRYGFEWDMAAVYKDDSDETVYLKPKLHDDKYKIEVIR